VADSSPDTARLPDYSALVRLLVEPLLDQPEVLKVDCETHPQKARVWVRVAIEGADKGKVFGRGGRTIQAIRTVLTVAGQSVGQTVHLEVFGEREHREAHREGRDYGRSDHNRPDHNRPDRSERRSGHRPPASPPIRKQDLEAKRESQQNNNSYPDGLPPEADV
jgi:predicted RNA-binding protein YlqC (UPF0109 family)